MLWIDHLDPRNERLLNFGVIWRGYIFLGLIEAALVMSGYFWVLFAGGWHLGQSLPFTDPLYLEATTMVFAGIVTSQIGNLLGCQTTRTSTFKVGVFKNKWIIRGILFEVAVMLSIVYIPYLQGIFGTTATWNLSMVVCHKFHTYNVLCRGIKEIYSKKNE